MSVGGECIGRIAGQASRRFVVCGGEIARRRGAANKGENMVIIRCLVITVICHGHTDTET